MVCAEDTHLLALSRRNFEAIVGAKRDAIVSEKVEFLRRFEFLRGLTNAKLLSLMQLMTLEKYRSGNLIYRQGDVCSKVFFIKSGEVEIARDIDAPPLSSFREVVTAVTEGSTRRLVGAKQKRQRVRLLILGESAYFGAVEMLVKKKEFRDTSAVCVSEEASLLSISMKVGCWLMAGRLTIPVVRNSCAF